MKLCAFEHSRNLCVRTPTADSTACKESPTTAGNAQPRVATFAAAFLLCAMFLVLCFVSAKAARADELGTVTSSRQAPCPNYAGALPNGQCYVLQVNCPGIDQLKAYLKVVSASNATDLWIFSTGGNSTVPMDTLTFGDFAFNQMLAKGISVTLISWGFHTQPQGWQTGPANGIRTTMCRYATLQQWIHDNLAVPQGLRMGAMGISAGSEEIAGSLSFYGAASLLSDGAIFGSGPPFAREDWSCDGIQPPTTNPCSGQPVTEGVGYTNALHYIDPSLPSSISCSYDLYHHLTTDDAFFLADSVNAPDADISWSSQIPNSWILGYDPNHPNDPNYSDTSSATGMAAIHWSNNPGHGGFQCTAAPHNLMATQAGAQTVADQVSVQAGHAPRR